ncbi:MAG: fumarylacetoacetate hydrolase family protein [Candidatus Lambdaproteobacteria bacterium]|nr:fumarylacetoacetate hydrolase family protein [Candidatus Lambdaproteobacteria bacterium]
MNTEAALNTLWDAAQQGRHFPDALRGQMSLQEALKVQLGVLERREARGEQRAGWKVGWTSIAVRRRNNTEERAFGHIVAQRVFDSGVTIPFAEIHGEQGVEPELCFTIGKTLKGPGITPALAKAAVLGVSPGFEINEGRAPKGQAPDLALSVADNLSQWGIVVGPMLKPVPPDFDFGKLRVEMRLGGIVEATAIGEKVIDDHYLSLSVLANMLGSFGVPLEAGQRVITGSFTKHTVHQGDSWEATFAGIGKVSATFA